MSRERGRRHLLFVWDTKGQDGSYELELMGMLPPVLKRELCYHIYGTTLKSMPFLAWLRDYDVCLTRLARCHFGMGGRIGFATPCIFIATELPKSQPNYRVPRDSWNLFLF